MWWTVTRSWHQPRMTSSHNVHAFSRVRFLNCLNPPQPPQWQSTTMLLSILKSVLVEPLRLILNLTPLARFLPRQDDFAPHPGAPFEGYYTRIVTASGSTILLIFSSVFSAADCPHLVHFSLLPRDANNRIVVDKFPRIFGTAGPKHPDDGTHEFGLVAKGDGTEGTYKVCRDEQRYRLELDTAEGKIQVAVDITKRTPWIGSDKLSTPEGVFSTLTFLPLHWNVFSTASSTEYSISRDGVTIEEGTGIAHQEKNWGVSFPAGWTWIQSFSKPHRTRGLRTFCLAGGKIMGQKAYLLGYRSEKIQWSFRPPFTLMPFCFVTPFAGETIDSKRGTARFEMATLSKKLLVEVSSPPDHEGWVGLCCPLSDGHRNTFAYETFEGCVRVRAFRRDWSLAWELVEDTTFEGAAVEFGGDYSFKAPQKDAKWSAGPLD